MPGLLGCCCVLSQWDTLVVVYVYSMHMCIHSSCILTGIKMCIIPAIHALSTAFFIFDFTVNKNPFYVTHWKYQTQYIGSCFSSFVVKYSPYRKSFNAICIVYNSAAMSYFWEDRLKFYFLFIPSTCWVTIKLCEKRHMRNRSLETLWSFVVL